MEKNDISWIIIMKSKKSPRELYDLQFSGGLILYIGFKVLVPNFQSISPVYSCICVDTTFR
jgi:hypothetical protein